jgi:hypothetical protein
MTATCLIYFVDILKFNRNSLIMGRQNLPIHANIKECWLHTKKLVNHLYRSEFGEGSLEPLSSRSKPRQLKIGGCIGKCGLKQCLNSRLLPPMRKIFKERRRIVFVTIQVGQDTNLTINCGSGKPLEYHERSSGKIKSARSLHLLVERCRSVTFSYLTLYNSSI